VDGEPWDRGSGGTPRRTASDVEQVLPSVSEEWVDDEAWTLRSSSTTVPPEEERNLPRPRACSEDEDGSTGVGLIELILKLIRETR